MLQCIAVCCSVFQCAADVLYCLHLPALHEHTDSIMVIPGVLQCAEVCCNVLQCVADVLPCVVVSSSFSPTRTNRLKLWSYGVCCSVLQHVAARCGVLVFQPYTNAQTRLWFYFISYCNIIPMCCSVLQCVAVCCSVLQCVAVCCSVLQCAAVCCSVL